MKYVKWFKDISQQDVSSVGIKGVGISELWQAGFPVPAGFILTSDAFNEFVKRSSITNEINNILQQINVEDNTSLGNASMEIQKLISQQSVPDEIREEITDAYTYLDTAAELRNIKSAHELIHANRSPPIVVARTSVIEQTDFVKLPAVMNLNGQQQVIEAIKKCWASLYSSEAISHMRKQNITKLDTAIIIQKQINSEKSGTVSAVNPKNKNEAEIVIEALYGINTQVSNTAALASYILDKNSDKVLTEIPLSQKHMLKRDEISGKLLKYDVPAGQSVLNEREIDVLLGLTKKIASQYHSHKCIEWAVEKNKLYVLQMADVKFAPEPEIESVPIASVPMANEQETKEESIAINVIEAKQPEIIAEPTSEVMQPKAVDAAEFMPDMNKIKFGQKKEDIIFAVKIIKEQLHKIERILNEGE